MTSFSKNSPNFQGAFLKGSPSQFGVHKQLVYVWGYNGMMPGCWGACVFS